MRLFQKNRILEILWEGFRGLGRDSHSFLLFLSLKSAKTKRGREEKRHDKHHDILWQFPSLCSIDIKRHKTSEVVIKCHDNLRQTSRQFMTFSVPSPSSRPLLDFAGFWSPTFRRVPSDSLRLLGFVHSQDIREIRGRNAFKSTLFWGDQKWDFFWPRNPLFPDFGDFGNPLGKRHSLIVSLPQKNTEVLEQLAMFWSSSPIRTMWRRTRAWGLMRLASSTTRRPRAFATHQLYIYIYACNLIWWAVLGFQDGMKQQEIRKNRGEKTKKLRKKRPKIQQKPPRFCGGFSGPFFTIKLGIFLDFCLFLAHQSRWQIYIYIDQPAPKYHRKGCSLGD